MAGLHGKVAVVTGAGSGIGRSIARLCGERGATVHVCDLDAAAAQAVAGEIGPRALAHTVDVTDAAAVEALAADVFARDGAVDLLFNNAGIGVGGEVADTPLEDWRRIVEVNLMGVIHGVHFFLPRLLAQGRPAHIVNTASMAGLVPTPALVPYVTTKFGVVGLSEALDLEVRRHGVRVTALCPGVIDTPIVRRAAMHGDWARRQDRIGRLYVRHGASPDVVAEAALAAVERRRVIATAPRSHVLPLWLLRRWFPPGARAILRASAWAGRRG